MTRKIVIVGGGITGVCLARELATVDGLQVTVVERDQAQLRGSTAFAPGFIGLYNSAAVLTDLARTSAEVYDAVGQGFERSGGLELSVSQSGTEEVERRVVAERDAGLPAHLITPARLPASVTHFVDAELIAAAGYFGADGVAVPTILTHALRTQADAAGATFLTGQAVVGVDTRGLEGHTVHLQDGTRLPADDVVLAGGIWGPALAELVDAYLPLFPVAHPYVYSGSSPPAQCRSVRAMAGEARLRPRAQRPSRHRLLRPRARPRRPGRSRGRGRTAVGRAVRRGDHVGTGPPAPGCTPAG